MNPVRSALCILALVPLAPTLASEVPASATVPDARCLALTAEAEMAAMRVKWTRSSARSDNVPITGESRPTSVASPWIQLALLSAKSSDARNAAAHACNPELQRVSNPGANERRRSRAVRDGVVWKSGPR
jgi:hypothetical protein